jgi:phosphoribosylformylglycinamidine synthase
LDIAKEGALQKALLEMIDAGVIVSAKDVSEGGIAATIAEAGFANEIGAEVKLASEGQAAECVLFGEDASRVIVSANPKLVGKIHEIANKHEVEVQEIGITSLNLTIEVDGKRLIAAPVAELKENWATGLERALHTETPEQLVPQVLERA